MTKETCDLAIIGGGPAGVSAAVYAARKKIDSLIITDSWGGQSVVSSDIQNWIGFPHISGSELAERFKAHVEEYAGEDLQIIYPDKVEAIKDEGDFFTLKLTSSKVLKAKYIFAGLGAKRRKLKAEGAERFEHKGLTYCASCDGPLFAGKDLAVVGGGNAGFESAAQLLAYANSVTLLERSESFKADPSTVEKLQSNEKFKALTNVELLSLFGDNFLEGIRYKDLKSSEEKELKVQGLFVEIGMVPNSDILADLLELNEYGQIKVDPRTGKSSHERIWAAGDCTDALYHQNNIASGDAVKALEDFYKTTH